MINAEASKDDREWVINQDNLKPELNKIDINSTNWEYNGSVFTTVEPSALNYSYQVEFSQKAILEETSNRSLDITVDVKFLEQNSVESIIPKEEKIEMIQGETKQLEYSLVPENAEIITPNWVSVDNNIVEVDEKGLVTAKAIGETEVLLKDGERTLGKFNIQVEKITMIQ
ncbi:Ig-like domain-containing protein [Enterococcus mundtii]|nr:Ig-like domain-containing protein [Enterococcus mundtii]